MDIFFFNISTVESLARESAPITEALRRRYYQMIWIIRGLGDLEIDTEIQAIEANTIYSIPPGRQYRFLPAAEVSGYVLSFNIDFLDLAIEGPGSPFFRDIKSELRRVNTYLWDPAEASLRNVLDDMRREFNTHLGLRIEILSGLFKIFLIYMKRQAVVCHREYGDWENTRLFNRFYAQLDIDFVRKKQVAEYASALAVTPGHLNAVIKRVTGHSASYHIRQRTIQEAKRMVFYDDASLKTVAHALGFGDQAHFSKYFKTAAGMTFSQFRKIRSVRHGA
jgi:AraC family transcriptional activator of pobA